MHQFSPKFDFIIHFFRNNQLFTMFTPGLQFSQAFFMNNLDWHGCRWSHKHINWLISQWYHKIHLDQEAKYILVNLYSSIDYDIFLWNSIHICFHLVIYIYLNYSIRILTSSSPSFSFNFFIATTLSYFLHVCSLMWAHIYSSLNPIVSEKNFFDSPRIL